MICANCKCEVSVVHVSGLGNTVSCRQCESEALAPSVCTRCQHRQCVCKPRERTFTESELRAVLEAKLAQVDSLIRTDGGTDLAYCASTLIALAFELGIDLQEKS